MAFNHAVRAQDEWFNEPDDLDRLRSALSSIDGLDDAVVAAGVLAFRVTRAQAFGEGNKRTALLLARWLLDRNGIDGGRVLPPNDFEFAHLLVKAASGLDVEDEIVALLNSRR